MDIDGAVALVTGAGSGLGRATAAHLARRGATVVGMDRVDLVRGVMAEVGGVPVVGDITRPDDVGRAVAAAAGAGHLRIVVNCAGGGQPAARTVSRSGQVMPLEPWERVVQLNLTAAYDVTRQAAAAIAATPAVDGGRGVVVHTSSIAAFDPSVGLTSYVASKAGVAALVGALARDLAVWQIRALAVAPGAFETPGYGRMPPEVRARREEQLVFPRRPGRPAEFASFVAHLVENDYLNGQCFRIDGALHVQD